MAGKDQSGGDRGAQVGWGQPCHRCTEPCNVAARGVSMRDLAGFPTAQPHPKPSCYGQETSRDDNPRGFLLFTSTSQHPAAKRAQRTGRAPWGG